METEIVNKNYRPLTAPPFIQELEMKWWKHYADFEEKFGWVQTPKVQKTLRGKYIRQIVEAVGKNGDILELGCGSGWLSIILAKSGSKSVTGIDFSPEQIKIAEKKAIEAGVSNKVKFMCTDGTQIYNLKTKFDCVVLHAFLHHLSKSEIEQEFRLISWLLKEQGKLFLFEPVQYSGTESITSYKWFKIQKKLAGLANMGKSTGLRKYAEEEKNWRQLVTQRYWGKMPFGPSPKELPFAPNELEEYLNKKFKINKKEVCMIVSHLVLQEWLLRGVSHPYTTKLMLPVVTRLARLFDYLIISKKKNFSGIWLFIMFDCQVKI